MSQIQIETANLITNIASVELPISSLNGVSIRNFSERFKLKRNRNTFALVEMGPIQLNSQQMQYAVTSHKYILFTLHADAKYSREIYRKCTK